jgi:hypothetical protein
MTAPLAAGFSQLFLAFIGSFASPLNIPPAFEVGRMIDEEDRPGNPRLLGQKESFTPYFVFWRA